MKRFIAFPSDKYIPETVRPIVDRYVELRSTVDDIRSNVVTLRVNVAQAQSQDISEAAALIATGNDVATGTKHRDAAIAAIEAAERQAQATDAAMVKVSADLQAAYVDAAGEAISLADEEFEHASAVYVKAIEELATARRAWHDAVGARRFATDATSGNRDASYKTQRIEDSDYATFRGEAAMESELLFAQPVRQFGPVHAAPYIQALIKGIRIPSDQDGNKLTILESDYARAIEFIEARSAWYEDGDGITKDNTPPDHVTIVRVPTMTDAMRAQSVNMPTRRR